MSLRDCKEDMGTTELSKYGGSEQFLRRPDMLRKLSPEGNGED